MSLEGKAKDGGKVKGKINRLNMIRGYSAYEVAVINGFEGTEEEWLASLRNETGLVMKDRSSGVKYEVYVDNGKLVMTESEE